MTAAWLLPRLMVHAGERTNAQIVLARRVRETPRRGLEKRKQCCGDDVEYVEYGESMFESIYTRRGDKDLRRGPRKCKRRYRGRVWLGLGSGTHS